MRIWKKEKNLSGWVSHVTHDLAPITGVMYVTDVTKI